ncbi:hypothetical protein E2542_SST29831 [Spatholobus suberectus]|nr:hypothetical protein E2542_SST29831 [Spatholobus suberectus]
MAYRSMLRSSILVEPFQFQPLHFSNRGGSRFKNVRAGPFRRARGVTLRCSSHNESPSFQDDQGPPQEAVLKAISEVSKAEGRVGQTTNMVIGGTVSDDSTNEWLTLDQKVNSYPTVRGFTAIGTGGQDFVQAMVVAVESVIQQPIPQGRVKQKLSARGKYVSVNIGPVQVVSSEQVFLSCLLISFPLVEVNLCSLFFVKDGFICKRT